MDTSREEEYVSYEDDGYVLYEDDGTTTVHYDGNIWSYPIKLVADNVSHENDGSTFVHYVNEHGQITCNLPENSESPEELEDIQYGPCLEYGSYYGRLHCYKCCVTHMYDIDITTIGKYVGCDRCHGRLGKYAQAQRGERDNCMRCKKYLHYVYEEGECKMCKRCNECGEKYFYHAIKDGKFKCRYCFYCKSTNHVEGKCMGCKPCEKCKYPLLDEYKKAIHDKCPHCSECFQNIYEKGECQGCKECDRCGKVLGAEYNKSTHDKCQICIHCNGIMENEECYMIKHGLVHDRCAYDYVKSHELPCDICKRHERKKHQSVFLITREKYNHIDCMFMFKRRHLFRTIELRKNAGANKWALEIIKKNTESLILLQKYGPTVQLPLPFDVIYTIFDLAPSAINFLELLTTIHLDYPSKEMTNFLDKIANKKINYVKKTM
jgi:hypothetical protein